MSFYFQHHWLWFLLGVAAALAASLMVYYKPSPYFDRKLRILLGTLRFFGLMVLVFLLMKPTSKRTIQEEIRPSIVIGFDHSASMLIHEDEEVLKNQWIEVRERWNKKFGDKFLLDWVGFESALTTADSHYFTGEETNLSAPIQYAKQRYSDDRRQALILFTDGWHNTGLDPWTGADQLNHPVYTIVYGDTIKRPDAAIERVTHNAFVYQGNKLEVESELSFKQLKGKTAKITLYVEGASLMSKTIPIDNAQSLEKVSFEVPTGKMKGLQRMRIAIEPMEGENFIENNQRDFVVEILDTKKKIWLLGKHPHPDLGALRNALEDGGRNEVVVAFSEEIPNDSQQPDLVVLHNMPVSSALQVKIEGVPSLYLIGASSVISDLNLEPRRQNPELVQPLINRNFSKFSIDDWWTNNARKLPPIETYSPRLSAAANSILSTCIVEGIATERPLIIAWESSGIPMIAINGLGIWQWRLHTFKETGSHQVFNDFIGQIFRYLGSVQKNQRLFVNYPQRVREGRSVIFDARFYDAAFQSTQEAKLSLQLFRNNEELFRYDFIENNDAYRLSIRDLDTGNFSFRVEGILGEEKIQTSGQFVVEAFQLENQRNEANTEGMSDLSLRTGGLMAFPNEISKIESTLEELGSDRILRERLKMRPLIDIWWFILFLILIFATEWFLRRRMGSY